MEEVSYLIYIMYPISSLSHLLSLCIGHPMIDTPSSSPVTVNVGLSRTLSCTSRGSPPDTFTWRKDSGPVLQSTNITAVNYDTNNAVFRADYTINNANINDGGRYTCTITNPIGSNSATITVDIISKLLL